MKEGVIVKRYASDFTAAFWALYCKIQIAIYWLLGLLFGFLFLQKIADISYVQAELRSSLIVLPFHFFMLAVPAAGYFIFSRSWFHLLLAFWTFLSSFTYFVSESIFLSNENFPSVFILMFFTLFAFWELDHFANGEVHFLKLVLFFSCFFLISCVFYSVIFPIWGVF